MLTALFIYGKHHKQEVIYSVQKWESLWVCGQAKLQLAQSISRVPAYKAKTNK